MSSKEESSVPQGAALWPQFEHNGVANNSLVIPQSEDGRRASWSGSQQDMAPESQSDSFSVRRSLTDIFSSVGKGARYVRRQKAMAPSKMLHRMEDVRPRSQFYVDIPKVKAVDVSLQGDQAAPCSHSCSTPPEQQQQQQQEQQKQVPLTPHHYSRPPPARGSGTPVCGVLVLPQAAQESPAYRIRARLFSGDCNPPTKPKEITMGAAPSTVLVDEPRERVAPFVVEQYGSMLAELMQRHGTRHPILVQDTDTGRHNYSESGDDEEGEEEGEDREAKEEEVTDGTTPLRVDGDVSEAPVGDCSNSSMTPKVLCETNQLTPISTELTPAPSPEFTSQDKRDRKIFLIAQEVMTSEQVFVDVLRLLNVDFRKFVCEWQEGGEELQGDHGQQDAHHAPVLPLHELNKILNYLPQLQNLNEEILSDLEVRIADWDKRKKISDVIVRKGPFLKLYSAYIREFQSQSDHLDHCCQTYPAFARALRVFESSERCTKLNLKHYMLKPVQRIPQYRLLLEEYLKFLPENSPDYVDTQTALAVVANVAAHANDTMKQGVSSASFILLGRDSLTV